MSDDERKSRLERALLYGGPTHTISDVARMIEQRTAQFWSRGDGMIVTELHTFPLVKTVNYWLVAGALRDCLELQAEIDAWAVAEGCEVATAEGRRGWGRAAAVSGWQQYAYAFRKPLGGSRFWSNQR